MSGPLSVSGSGADPGVVSAAVHRVVAVEGTGVLADPGRLRALVMDELGSDGRRNRAAVDALCDLAADVGAPVVQSPMGQVGALLEGWVTTQQHVDPALARWAAEATSSAMNAGPPPSGSWPSGSSPDPWVPIPPPDSASPTGRRRAVLAAVVVVAAVVAAGIGFAVGTATAEPGTSIASTVTSTSTVTVTSRTSTAPPVIAGPADIRRASIVGRWAITLTAIECDYISNCPAYGETGGGTLVIDCAPDGCTGTYNGYSVTVSYDGGREVWVLNGAYPEAYWATCDGVPVFTGQDWTLQTTQARAIPGTGWEATTLEGQRVINTPATDSCRANHTTWTATGQHS